MPIFALAADEMQSAARNADAVGAPADRNTPADTGTAAAPSAGTADLRVTPTPTQGSSSSGDSEPIAPTSAQSKPPPEFKVRELIEPATPNNAKPNSPAQTPQKKQNTVLLAVIATAVLGTLAWAFSKFFRKSSTEKSDGKDNSRCKNIKSLLDQKIKEAEETAKSWPEEKLKELIIQKTLTEEQKALLAKYNTAKKRYENLKKTVDLLKGKYDLCMMKLPSANELKLVKAEQNDIDKLLMIENNLSGSKIYSAMTEKSEWEEAFKKGETIYLIKKGYEILGNVSYEKRSDGSVYISGLAILPHFQKQGVGKEVVRRILDELKDVKKINLVTHPDNLASIKLYESFGFKTESRKENYYGDGEPRLIMVLNK